MFRFLSLDWDQQDCSIAILGVEPSSLTDCPPVRPGTYALVFEWNGVPSDNSAVGSPHFTGRATFRIGA